MCGRVELMSPDTYVLQDHHPMGGLPSAPNIKGEKCWSPMPQLGIEPRPPGWNSEHLPSRHKSRLVQQGCHKSRLVQQGCKQVLTNLALIHWWIGVWETWLKKKQQIRSFDSGLTEEKEKYESLLRKHIDVFSEHQSDIGNCDKLNIR